MKQNILFTGACTALVTPFLGDKVNYPMAVELVRRQMAAGVQTVVLAGTTGEAPTLSDTEKLELFSRCKEFAGSDCTIIAGTGSNSTQHAIALSRAAQGAGADALLVVTPYYNKATPEGLYAHYASIAEAVDIPIILYNVPGRTGVDIPVSVYQRLSAIENIAGVKEASANTVKISRIRSACGPSFGIWSGNDDMTLPAISQGAHGVISVVSNVCPGEMEALCQAALAGDYAIAGAIHRKLLPLMDALFLEVNPIPVKAAMKLLGYDCGPCRMPLTDLLPQHEEVLKSIIH